MKTLFLVTAGYERPKDSELELLEASDQHPRISLFNRELNTDMVDEEFLNKVRGPRRFIYKVLPVSVTQLVESFLRKGKYDAVISWGEHLGIPLALIFKLTSTKIPHITLFSWISNGKKGTALKAVCSHIDRMILMSSVQRNYAVNVLKLPASKVALLRWPVDTKFWRPVSVESDMICSVGREMRDYGTLLKAIRELNIPCHIAAATFPGKRDSWVEAVEEAGPLPPHITIGKKMYAELRDMYARSRFLVVPILPTDTDNGTTSILEAMAMGKPVICSKTKGQADVIQDGKNGFFVPVGDVRAMREKILYLWNNPGVVARMGRHARSFVEEHHSLDKFVEQVKSIVAEAIAERANHHAKAILTV